jgi:hypothetical protein
VAPIRRDMRRAEHSERALDAAAKITDDDVAHAAATWRQVAPPDKRQLLQAPDYEGDATGRGKEL